MFPRFTNILFQSSRHIKFQALPRRLFSSNSRSLQLVGLSSVLGVSAVGLFSANVLLSEKDDEKAKGIVDLYLTLKRKYLSGDVSPVSRDVYQKLELLEKDIEEMYLDDFKNRLSELVGKTSQVVIPTNVKNTAFVFIKPHAATDAVKELVENTLKKNDIAIVSSGTIAGKEIDEKMYIDQHYYSIASKATLLKPTQLNVPAEKFKNKFGLEWNDALGKGVVYNAKDACDVLGLDSAGLNAVWARCKKEKKLIKFGGGFYCGLIDTVPNKPAIYVFNGFFMAMRNKFVSPDALIKYFVVEWDAKKMSWEDFRGQLLGSTDPADSPEGSLRNLVYKNWKSLGLTHEPNVGDNGIHASASPFEALAERMNWLEVPLESDEYGKLMLDAGIPAKLIKEWSVDPQVLYGARSLPIKMSLFDSVEDTDSDMCLARAMMIMRGVN